jgi:hypothetical protein
MNNGVAASTVEVAHETNGAVRALPGQRQPGRPSTVARFDAQIREWLGAEPMLSGAALLARARLAGYHGGKSALYELVRRIRQATSGHDSQPTNGAAPGAVIELFSRRPQEATLPSTSEGERAELDRDRDARCMPDALPAPSADDRREEGSLRCRCGGLLRFDLAHLADAERLGCREQVPLFWKCLSCGRSRKSEESYPLRQIVASLDHEAFAHHNGSHR